MKNFLAPIVQNKVVGSVVSNASKFYVAHESAILTGGTIGFSWAATALAMKNSSEINYILEDYRIAVQNCNTKEEKNDLLCITLRSLARYILPILIFEGLATTCAIFSKRRTDKIEARLAETASALTIAQAAITQYQAFTKEAETVLGEKKYQKLQEDIYKGQEFDGRRFTHIAYEGAPGEILLIDKYSGKPFWCTTDRVSNAATELSRRLSPEGGYDIQTVDDWYNLIGNKDLIPEKDEGVLATKFGYVADGYGTDEICARFVDRRYVFPNGTFIPAFMVYLYPEPACIDDTII